MLPNCATLWTEWTDLNYLSWIWVQFLETFQLYKLRAYASQHNGPFLRSNCVSFVAAVQSHTICINILINRNEIARINHRRQSKTTTKSQLSDQIRWKTRRMIAIFDMQNTEHAVNIAWLRTCDSHKLCNRNWVLHSIEVDFANELRISLLGVK